MKLSDNTILITGGGSGIGEALAHYFSSKGNKVILAGRNEQKLADAAGKIENAEYATLDIADRASIDAFAASMRERFPNLNAVIHNAGIMERETIGDGDADTAERLVMTNLLGQIWLNSALVPLVTSNPEPWIMTVTSGLAFIPRADFPTYCATKAALHSYTQSLRAQIKGRARVLELIPPFVQTELTGPQQATDERALPLTDFIDEVTAILETHPDTDEIAVERVQFQYTAAEDGKYDEKYKEFNARFGIET